MADSYSGFVCIVYVKIKIPSSGETVFLRKDGKIRRWAFGILHPSSQGSAMCKDSLKCKALWVKKMKPLQRRQIIFAQCTMPTLQWSREMTKLITEFLKSILVTNCAIASHLICFPWRLRWGSQCVDLWHKYKCFLHFFLLTSSTSWRTWRAFVWFGEGSVFTNGWRVIKK